MEPEKRHQLLVERWETRRTAGRQIAENGKPLQELHSKVATVTAKLRERRELTTETAKELNVARADVVLQTRL